MCTKHDGTLSFQQIDYIVEAFLFLVANRDYVVVDHNNRLSDCSPNFDLIVIPWSSDSEAGGQSALCRETRVGTVTSNTALQHYS